MQSAGLSSIRKDVIGGNYLDLLQGQIDLARVPFSDRGSRLVIGQSPGRSSLYIRLGERLTSLDPHPEAYLGRPAFIPALEFLDQNGEALPFQASASPDLISLQTRIGKFKLLFYDERTLAVGLPPQTTAGISLQLNSEHFRPGAPGARGEPVRRLAYASNAEPAREEIAPGIAGPSIEYLLGPGLDRTILLCIDEAPQIPREIPAFSELHHRATARWKEWFSHVPPVRDEYADKYAYAWWVMANNLISPRGCIQVEAMAPSKASYIGLWLWDSALHALAFRHLDPELARNQIRAFLAMQQPDGMLPDAIFDEAPVFELDHPVQGKVTKPPVLAWAALKVHETAPDIGFLREIYPALARWNAWWFEQNDDDLDGLAQYTHPYSSGLDDSPLWDHGLPVESPDLNTYLFLTMESLATMARYLGLKEEALAWKQSSEKLVQRMLEHMWDEEAGLFWALHNEQPIPVTTPANLLPLWTGQLPEQVVARVLANLTDENRFWGGWMLPSVARDDPAFDPETMWRGPVWANLNYFFIEALNRSRKRKLARQLRTATLDLIMSQPSIYEYYSAETGEPPPRSVPAFGWTAAVFIDLAIQASRETSQSK
jgi:hypothetical protein